MRPTHYLPRSGLGIQRHSGHSEVFFCARKSVCVYLPHIPFCALKTLARYSILPGLSLSGILHVNIVTGSFNASKFAEFIDVLLTQMNPFPGPNSVIVMDNCSIHKRQDILGMIEQR